jgi:hypothetical protein
MANLCNVISDNSMAIYNTDDDGLTCVCAVPSHTKCVQSQYKVRVMGEYYCDIVYFLLTQLKFFLTFYRFIVIIHSQTPVSYIIFVH